MNINRAKEILELLAQGINPYTGECLEDSHVCSQPETIRALYCAIRELEHKESPRRKQPENAGQPWSGEDDDKLWRLHESGTSVSELKKIFKRSQRSIELRLMKLSSDRAPFIHVRFEEKEKRMKNAAEVMQNVYRR